MHDVCIIVVHGWCRYEDVVSSATMHHRSVTMEIVRRGALILFCDYVVRMRCVHCTTVNRQILTSFYTSVTVSLYIINTCFNFD